MLFPDTPFAPTDDRDVPGKGVAHKTGEVAAISLPGLGAVTSSARLTTDCAPWTFGVSHLMRNLAKPEFV